MASTLKPILFVSHTADRSGAPLLLLEIIKALQLHSEHKVHIICMEDGALVDEFKKYGKTYIWKKKSRNYNTRNIAGWISRNKQIVNALSILYKVRKVRLVFYNTIVNGHLQKKLSFLKCKTICYVHEMESAIRMLTNAEGRNFTFKYTDLFLCVSRAVKHNLIENHKVNILKTEIIPSPIEETFRSKNAFSTIISSFKEKNNIHNETIIGVVAGNEWRKGFDLFIPLIILYFNLFPTAKTVFVWKGFRPESENAYFHLYDYERCGLQDKIMLLPHGSDSLATMACFDIHLLLSREDPYPLVLLEAASFGIPTVCFEDSGGASEFIEEDCGYCIPYADLYMMANKLYYLTQNQEISYRLGENSRKKVMKKHDKNVSLKKITDIIFEQI